jgi:N-acetylglutamate synthase-like GNAT family acetyltransferase
MRTTIRKAVMSDVPVLVEMIREAFQDVAVRFELTEENCPKHPSNCQASWITRALETGVRYFVIEVEGSSCGCAALEQASPEVCYLERLAVLPLQRRQGYGRALVVHGLAEAKELGSQRVDIGIIAAHTELRDWYRNLGFVDQRMASFPHLPFQVLFMSLALDRLPPGERESVEVPRYPPRFAVLGKEERRGKGNGCSTAKRL